MSCTEHFRCGAVRIFPIEWYGMVPRRNSLDKMIGTLHTSIVHFDNVRSNVRYRYLSLLFLILLSRFPVFLISRPSVFLTVNKKVENKDPKTHLEVSY